MTNENNILSWQEAKQLADKCREAGGIIVTTNGCFDILHRGHVRYLNEAKQKGDLLLVAINSDASVKKLKGPTRPINAAEDRAYVLSHLRSVDGVCLFEEDTPIVWLEHIRPHIHVKGGDYDATKIPEYPVLKKWGGEILIVPFAEGYSTTKLIEKTRTK